MLIMSINECLVPLWLIFHLINYSDIIVQLSSPDHITSKSYSWDLNPRSVGLFLPLHCYFLGFVLLCFGFSFCFY